MQTTSLLRYLALGDSTSVGIGAGADGGYPMRLAKRLKAAGFPVGYLNRGISGATVADLLNGPVHKAAASPPDLVTLGIGGNDAWRLVPEETFSARLAQVADVLEKTGAAVVVCNIADLGLSPAAAIAQSWIGVTPELISARIRRLNLFIDALANRPRFRVVDLFRASHEVLPSRSDIFSPDGFHPSAAGYDHWADLCWPAVSEAAAGWAKARNG